MFRIISAENECKCFEKYFDDRVNVKCLPCHYSCKNCTGA